MEIGRGGAGGRGRRALPGMNLVRELTDQIVLDTVFEQAPITRAEVAQRTGISKTTVSEAFRRLEGAGLLRTAGTQRGRPGRAGTYYRVAADAGFVIAVDLNSTELRLCAADIFGQPFLESAHPPPHPHDREHVAGQLRELVRGAMEQGTAGHRRLLAVGVSVANPVDPVGGNVVALEESPFPEGLFQPRDALEGLFTAPLLVENDVNLAAVAERWRGAARESASFAYVHIGAGLGMGLVIDDQLIRGARGVAGEIGYLSPGRRTPGGATDRPALARAVAEEGFGPGEGVDAVGAARAVFARAAAGDAEARAVIDRVGRTIGEAVAAVCAVVDPELVVLGGPIGLEPALVEPVRAAVAAQAPLPPPIAPGALGENAALHGALVLALRRGRAELSGRG